MEQVEHGINKILEKGEEGCLSTLLKLAWSGLVYLASKVGGICIYNNLLRLLLSASEGKI